MYYEKANNHYYATEEDIFRDIIFCKGLYKKGFSKWSVKEQKIEVKPFGIFTKKIFKVYSGKKKYQKTVIEIKNIQNKVEFFTVEKWIEKSLKKDYIWTEYGKQKYSQVLQFFLDNPTVKDLQKNFEKFEKTLDKSNQM
jgi:predicted S18 family serine protease